MKTPSMSIKFILSREKYEIIAFQLLTIKITAIKLKTAFQLCATRDEIAPETCVGKDSTLEELVGLIPASWKLSVELSDARI